MAVVDPPETEPWCCWCGVILQLEHAFASCPTASICSDCIDGGYEFGTFKGYFIGIPVK